MWYYRVLMEYVLKNSAKQAVGFIQRKKIGKYTVYQSKRKMFILTCTMNQ